MTSRYYVLDGHEPRPIEDIHEWSRIMAMEGVRQVARTELPGDVSVSTVFLGIDHNWREGGKPILFESMTFGLPGEEEGDNLMNRYRTWEEAEAGHLEMVAEVSARLTR